MSPLPTSRLQVSDDSLEHIFRTILDWHLSTRGFPHQVANLAPSLISATLEVYSQSMAKLLPTPTKSHYVFNLRDFARVVQVRLRTVVSSCSCPTPAPCLPRSSTSLRRTTTQYLHDFILLVPFTPLAPTRAS